MYPPDLFPFVKLAFTSTRLILSHYPNLSAFFTPIYSGFVSVWFLLLSFVSANHVWTPLTTIHIKSSHFIPLLIVSFWLYRYVMSHLACFRMLHIITFSYVSVSILSICWKSSTKTSSLLYQLLLFFLFYIYIHPCQLTISID